MRLAPRPAALLLAGAVALSACGSAARSGRDDGTTATQAPTASAHPRSLPIRTDLVNPQVVAWRGWRAVDDHTLEVTVTAGPAGCYGADPQVAETDGAVRIRVRVGRLPHARDRECPAIALESVVPVRLVRPLGSREVQHLA